MTCRNFRYDLLRGGAGNGSPTSDHRRTSFETAAPVFDRKVPRAGCTRNNRILSLPPFEPGLAPSRYGGIASSEERRVGEACCRSCRSRMSPYPYKKKKK